MAETTTTKALQDHRVLNRKPPQFALGDAVTFRHQRGDDEGVVIGISIHTPFGYEEEDTDPDDWYYEVQIYASSDPVYWEVRTKLEERGIFEYLWFGERDLLANPSVKINFMG